MSISDSSFFKNTNLKVYLFFLLFTTVLAVIIKLAKVYDATTIVTMTVVGVPQSLVLSNEGQAAVEVDYETNGFTLLQNGFQNMELKVPFKDLSENNGGYEWRFDLNRLKVAQMLNASNDKLFVRPERLFFSVDSLSEFTVPVVVRHNFEYGAGYGSDGPLVIEPSEVQIIGAADKISQIDTIYTVPLEKGKLSENVSTQIALDISLLPTGVTLIPEVVQLDQKVTKYTEGTLEIAVEIINADATVQLFPKKIKVFYQVAVKDFDQVHPGDFSVVCDFSKKNVDDHYMTLELARAPKVVSDVRLGTNQVKYVIVE
tara:strand:- start:12982 stop:13926 length:945 start_codon:yes stop_codon:yes gene_type:complete